MSEQHKRDSGPLLLFVGYVPVVAVGVVSIFVEAVAVVPVLIIFGRLCLLLVVIVDSARRVPELLYGGESDGGESDAVFYGPPSLPRLLPSYAFRARKSSCTSRSSRSPSWCCTFHKAGSSGSAAAYAMTLPSTCTE